MILILLALAFLCFVLAALNVKSDIGLVPLGLAMWVFSAIYPLIG
jgi:hypothetical protein